MQRQPQVCLDPVKLHKLWWKKFTFNVQWGSMSLVQKQDHFRNWLFQKFSLDPEHKCMTPGFGSKRKLRNEAGWENFCLSDAELDELVKSVFDDYGTQQF